MSAPTVLYFKILIAESLMQRVSSLLYLKIKGCHHITILTNYDLRLEYAIEKITLMITNNPKVQSPDIKFRNLQVMFIVIVFRAVIHNKINRHLFITIIYIAICTSIPILFICWPCLMEILGLAAYTGSKNM